MPFVAPTINAPRLAGLSLRAFAALVDAPGVGGLVLGQMLAQFGIGTFRAAPADGGPHRVDWPMPEGGAHPDVAALIAAPHHAPGFRFPSLADYQNGDPVAVARRVLEKRVAGTFIAMDEADLMTQAEESARRIQSGRARVLEGVPIAIKDEIDQAPYPTTVGTSFLGTAPASADATVVARLRAAGALLIGKCNMHELGLGVSGINPHHGAARNPYDPGHMTGGSSSGSAAAAASGFCPVAIGADGGGSIRIPASFCGMVGLKPSFGRVSEHGAAPLCWSVAHVGPIGANVRDVAAIYALIAGPDPADPGTLAQPPVRATLDGPRPRIGIDRAYFEASDPDVVAACLALLDGYEIVEVEMPDPNLVRLAHVVVIVGEMAAARMIDLNPAYGVDTRLNFALAGALTASDYVHALRLRGTLAAQMRALFDRVDVLVTPSTACTAPAIREDALSHGESDLPLLDRIMRYAPAANLFGLPAISAPAGYDRAGLPIGIQAMGRMWEEHVLLGLAAEWEKKVERRKPRVWIQD